MTLSIFLMQAFIVGYTYESWFRSIVLKEKKVYVNIFTMIIIDDNNNTR